MKKLLSAAAASMFAVGIAMAQTPPSNNPDSSGTSTGAAPSANPVGTMHDGGKGAASGDTNQAVVTTGANADQPAKGSNSFTQKQAAKRIAAKGYTNVSGLAKDGNGVWRGTGTKDGKPVQVWLDYKGNVGQQS